MTSASPLSVPGLGVSDALAIANSKQANLNGLTAAKAKTASQDFEAVFLNSMFSQMFTGVEGDGPFGGSGASGVWRSFLTDEYAKSFAKSGGIGIGDQVYRALIERQGVQS